MALEHINLDGSEDGESAAIKINAGFDQTDANQEAIEDLGSAFVLIGNWDPSSGEEYPAGVGYDFGSFWYIDTLANPTGNLGEPYYKFTTGDLNGHTATVGDLMLWSSSGWMLAHGNMDMDIYYRLDGTKDIIDSFAGGGQQFKNAADGIDEQDLTTLVQVEAKIDIGVYNRASRSKQNKG